MQHYIPHLQRQPHILHFRRSTISRIFGASTVAHFARKVRGTNIAVAKHGLKNNKIMPQSADHVRYVFVALTLRAK